MRHLSGPVVPCSFQQLGRRRSEYGEERRGAAQFNAIEPRAVHGALEPVRPSISLAIY